MDLKNAESIVEEFKKLGLVESAEVVANSEGDGACGSRALFAIRA